MITQVTYGASPSGYLRFKYIPEILELKMKGRLQHVEVIENEIRIIGTGILTYLKTQKGEYNFSEIAGNIFYDSSGNGEHIKATLVRTDDADIHLILKIANIKIIGYGRKQ